MITEITKNGKIYNTPTGLQEDSYYEMIYDLMDYVNEKDLPQGKPNIYLQTTLIWFWM